MKYNLYTLWDKLGKEYCPPFQCATHEQAVRRTIISIVQSRSINTDFELYWIGTFDTTSAAVKPGKPIFLDITEEWTLHEKTIETMLFDVNKYKAQGLKPWATPSKKEEANG